MLAARRLIEAGVPFVYVDFPYWDWHGGTPHPEGTYGTSARGHWGVAQFALVAGVGFLAAPPYAPTSTRRQSRQTLYHLLGIDPDHELYTTDNRPLKLITEDVPLIREVMA